MSQAALKFEDLPHYTYEDYVQWEGKWEIIHGIPYAMTPSPTKTHQRLAVKIAAQLENLLVNCESCQVYLPIDWQITEDTVVQPDLLVVCDENPDDVKLSVPPVLVFEILSPSTSRKDRTLKYRLYENAGVKYYCIIDPVKQSADVFTLLDGEKQYRETGEFHDGKILFDLGKCTMAFDFARIFNPR
jgi:Uma2 family endonuclease